MKNWAPYAPEGASAAQVAAFWTNLGVFSGSEPASAYPGTSLTFVPTDDTWADGAWQHGGDVSTETKHFLYAGANIVAAAGAPWFLLAVDQVGSTLGAWFGMPGSDIAQVFPNLANFSNKNIGFI